MSREALRRGPARRTNSAQIALATAVSFVVTLALLLGALGSAADAQQPQMNAYCHATGNADNPFVYVEVLAGGPQDMAHSNHPNDIHLGPVGPGVGPEDCPDGGDGGNGGNGGGGGGGDGGDGGGGGDGGDGGGLPFDSPGDNCAQVQAAVNLQYQQGEGTGAVAGAAQSLGIDQQQVLACFGTAAALQDSTVNVSTAAPGGGTVTAGGGGGAAAGAVGGALPETGGASLLALGAGALLVAGGLLARRIVR
jgi:hypothetical protein